MDTFQICINPPIIDSCPVRPKKPSQFGHELFPPVTLSFEHSSSDSAAGHSLRHQGKQIVTVRVSGSTLSASSPDIADLSGYVPVCAVNISITGWFRFRHLRMTRAVERANGR
jgi:hypothetical protein